MTYEGKLGGRAAALVVLRSACTDEIFDCRGRGPVTGKRFVKVGDLGPEANDSRKSPVEIGGIALFKRSS
ncbi:unnamed protein product [Hymenolepis diminuta]|uniref:Uncharacterized protein n=1 Tax=Hymenolepis diminuta TaxID=6216 RepID=A0A564YWE2_HYMDI|nr:unnamed protein product [Hymenolepis diminuta]